MFLQLRHNTYDKLGFGSKLKEILGENTIVNSLEPRNTLQIRDKNCLKTVVDIQLREASAILAMN